VVESIPVSTPEPTPAAVPEPPEPVEAGALARNRAARRRRVLDAALALAATGGFDAVQMRDVAAEAGVAIGTVYRYFDSKERLIIEAYIGEIEALGSVLRARPPAGETAADRVLDVLRRANAALQRYPEATGAMVRAVGAAPASEADAVRRINDAMNSIIAGAMHRPGEEGATTPEDLAVARTLNQVWFSALVGWVGGVDPAERVLADLEAAARRLIPEP
jgi:AcrR family transcriptional regulator